VDSDDPSEPKALVVEGKLKTEPTAIIGSTAKLTSLEVKGEADLADDVITKKQQMYKESVTLSAPVAIRAKDANNLSSLVRFYRPVLGSSRSLLVDAKLQTDASVQVGSLEVTGDAIIGDDVSTDENTMTFHGPVQFAKDVTLDDSGSGITFWGPVTSTDPAAPARLKFSGNAPVAFKDQVVDIEGIVQESGVGLMSFEHDVSVGAGGASFSSDVTMDKLTFSAEGQVTFDALAAFDDVYIDTDNVSFGDHSTIQLSLQQPTDMELVVNGAVTLGDVLGSPTLHVTLEYPPAPEDDHIFVGATDGLEGTFDNIAGDTLAVTGSDGEPVVVFVSIHDGAVGGKVTGGGIQVTDGHRVLRLVGTDQADRVEVKVRRGELIATGGFLPGGLLSLDLAAEPIDRLVVLAMGGDDLVHIVGDVGLPLLVDGGAGEDQLESGSPAVLLGGDDDDRLIGSRGNDVLVGGRGTDSIKGKGGDDILIGGSLSSFDTVTNKLGASLGDVLFEILDEWNSGEDYIVRVTSLREVLVAGGTVIDDSEPDTLVGEPGRDWFFANLYPDDHQTILDVIKGRKPNELVDEL
jgi:Ca2+-binding RTX toxin-like protein